DREDCVLGVNNRLVAGSATYDALVVLVDCHHRWHKTFPFCGGDDDRFTALHYCGDRVCRSTIDTIDFSHYLVPPNVLLAPVPGAAPGRRAYIPVVRLR